MGLTIDKTIRTFGGTLYKLSHQSKVLDCPMKLNVFIPEGAKKLPTLFYLSGLTCSPENATEKGFFAPSCVKHNLAIVFPDTSPRETNLPGEHDSWDFGSAAGFYLNATEDPWKKHYNMESYIVEELPSLVFSQFADELDSGSKSILGHSMGGHGALTLFLRHPGAYKSVSAFSPISNPVNCPWGTKAFNGYLGKDKSTWGEHDATELVQKYKGPTPVILIDVGTSDNFYNDGQLLPENFLKASSKSEYNGKVDLRLQAGYDHSYFFISSFAEDHIAHHAKYLTK